MHIRRWVQIALIPVLMLLTACQSAPVPQGMKVGNPYVIDGKTYYPEYDKAYDRTGQASWYGPGFHGKYTANGEIYDQNDLTAASPTLPMPSIVRVTNLENGKSSLIRVNDRGPFKSNRIIDLSKRSAQTLGIHSLAQVRVQFLEKETQEYMESVKRGRPISMVAFNERAASSPTQFADASPIQPAEQAPVIAGGAAPLIQVSSNTITGGTISSNDVPAPAGATSTTATTTTVIRPTPPPNTADNYKLIKEVWADDNVTLPSPESKQALEPAGKSPPQPVPKTTVEPVQLMRPNRVASADPPAGKTAPSASAGKLAVPSGGKLMITAGSFSSEENARKLASKLATVSTPSVDQVTISGKEWWRVRVGPFTSRDDAEQALSKVKSAGVADARIAH
ncbi:MAG: septal ring lytic transglycosylase RlpA family protein [Rickettsiales bacterium]|nr:septal ring lytic transglycosylase RlpA family protein [Rickettsiales bacterium]